MPQHTSKLTPSQVSRGNRAPLPAHRDRPAPYSLSNRPVRTTPLPPIASSPLINPVTSHPTPPKTRFLILSDTHDLDLSKFHPPKVDVILHCGDLTASGGLENYESFLRGLGAMDAELRLVIAGNHDVEMDRAFFLSQQGDLLDCDKVQNLWKGPLAASMGITYLHEGTHAFTLSSGATFTIYASPYTPRYGVSALQYPTSEDRYNPPLETPRWAISTGTDNSIIPSFPAIDIMMTHGPPKYVLDATADRSSGGCEHLRRALCRARPLLHCFGHIHNAWGARTIAWNDRPRDDDVDGDANLTLLEPEPVAKGLARRRGWTALSTPGFVKGRKTLCVNAAVANRDSEPGNVPWVVELYLPRAWP